MERNGTKKKPGGVPSNRIGVFNMGHFFPVSTMSEPVATSTHARREANQDLRGM